MVKTIIKCAVAILCTVAICVTIFVCTGNNGADATPDYMTEAQAAEYLGISAERLEIMRKNLKYLEGAYVSYSYEVDGEVETVYMYSKQALNDTMAELMDEEGKKNINFKYIEQIIKEQNQ
ncbi:MAG: hypothetical protein IJZ57_04260 [Clostridia bacterium]|nr:hypothetical protein [Clostridia bacterium]